MLEQQLPLPILQIDDDTLANFFTGNNDLLIASLQKNFAQVSQQFFYLWGEAGSGKSHLLKAISNEFLLQNRPSIYVPLSKSQYFSPEVLDNLEHQDLVCLDDLQAVIGQEEWEVALFNLFNRIKERGQCMLVMSANVSPMALSVNLPDLASRLKWGEIYQLSGLTESQKIHVLQRNARHRGIDLSDETANFLLKRLDRDMQTLLDTLVTLDKASLQAQRKLTIPFVKETLGL